METKVRNTWTSQILFSCKAVLVNFRRGDDGKKGLPAVQKILIILGILMLVIGILWPWVAKLPIGRLPGDIIIDKPGLKVYIPITTMILVSVIVSVILWLLRK
ncbi:MAG: DUF2905 domain-containing protein [Desulfobacterales bacterium]